MRKIIVLIFVITCISESWAQIAEFDKLEMYYAQQHYKTVYRKANRLLDQPEYDYSLLPKFYKALSLFQLAQNEHWLIRKPGALDEATTLFTDVRKEDEGGKVMNAHVYEVAALKSELNSWAEDLKRTGDKEKFDKVRLIMAKLFDDIPSFEAGGEVKPNDVEPSNGNSTKEREEIVAYAKKYLGVPYVWAGNDPSGFDCSGFTSYVLKKAGKELPRRAVDQYDASVKLKEKNVDKGDLIFFDNGSGISHVGIVISDKGAPIVMIHASSSKGIVITDIDKSEYWQKRLYGFGSFLD